MQIDSTTAYYGAGVYASAANAGRNAQQKSSDMEEDEVRASSADTVEISDAARGYNGASTVDTILERALEPHVSLDEIGDKVRSGEQELLEIVGKARGETGVTGHSTMRSVGIHGQIATVYMTSVHIESESERTRIADGTYVELNTKRPDVSEEDRVAMNAASDNFRNTAKSENMTEKFQNLGALNAIATLAESDASFRGLYENDPRSAVSEYKDTLGKLMQKYSLVYTASGASFANSVA